MLRTFNHSFSKGELSSSQKQSIITLIYIKKDRDTRFIKSWWPISLLYVDLKVASKALAFRMRKVIPLLIHPDQTAYVKGRYIGESVRIIEDILDHIDGIRFVADIEKAFDSVEHNFIFSVLRKFGFGPEFIQWIKTTFCNAESCVMNNGSSTGYFSLEKGTRQGDPLSPICLDTCSGNIIHSDL